jgi:hypothetical protein
LIKAENLCNVVFEKGPFLVKIAATGNESVNYRNDEKVQPFRLYSPPTIYALSIG